MSSTVSILLTALSIEADESTEEREAEACIKTSAAPARYPFLFSNEVLTVELGGSRQDGAGRGLRNPSHESRNSIVAELQSPVPRNTM